MRKAFDIKKLDQIAIIGVGLLGGSIGLGLRAAGYRGRRIGIGRRKSSLDKALQYDAVDQTFTDAAEGVQGCKWVVLCTPVGTFGPVLKSIAPVLGPGTVVTDVGSTKAEVCRQAARILPDHVEFVGAHPMAGSEKTGVEFSRADLFEHSLCILTPTEKTPATATRQAQGFWEVLGSRTVTLTPRQHDECLARVSHLPHAVATALVHLSLKDEAIDLAGPGFADVTRVASGDPGLWTDIFLSNKTSMVRSVNRLIRQLEQLRDRLTEAEADEIHKWLAQGKEARDAWVDRRYQQKDLPP